jgi:hypothetical protein
MPARDLAQLMLIVPIVCGEPVADVLNLPRLLLSTRAQPDRYICERPMATRLEVSGLSNSGLCEVPLWGGYCGLLAVEFSSVLLDSAMAAKTRSSFSAPRMRRGSSSLGCRIVA